MSRTQRTAVIATLAGWLGAPVDRVAAHVPDAEARALDAALRCTLPPLLERAARRASMTLLRHAGDRRRMGVTTAAKRLRRAVGQRLPVEPRWAWAETFGRVRHALGVEGMRWNGRVAAVCLTHDLDSHADVEQLDHVLALERERGMRSTVNVLTAWGYRLEADRLNALRGEGFEIGLHGGEHDVALGYRRASTIRRRVEAARAALPCPVTGFRAPALGASERLLSVLEALGFVYDSSLPAFDPSGRGVGTCYPYRYPGLNLWEVPLTVQDSALFRDAGLGDVAALALTRRLLDRVLDAHGVFVINTHPAMIAGRNGFYAGLLDAVAASGALVATLDDVVTLARAHAGPVEPAWSAR